MAEYRYENKYIIDRAAAELLKLQLKTFMQLDQYSVCDEYSYDIRSLYFDDLDSSAYYDKVDGVEFRKKYRIRMYNGDPKTIKLECKYKDEQMTRKESCHLTKQNATYIIQGKLGSVKLHDEFFLRFATESKVKLLKPSVIVDYRRLAFVYPFSEVRITFDTKLKTGCRSTAFFDTKIPTPDVFCDDQIVLEVKYNEFLPIQIRAILDGMNLTKSAVSKFALCDEYK